MDMKIGIISDSHDQLELLDVAFVELRKRQVELVCHLGDWVAPFSCAYVDKLAKEMKVPVKGVLGNNDGDIYNIIKGAGGKWDIEMGRQTKTVKLPDRTIVLYHGTDENVTESLIESKRYDVVLVGHTHRQHKERRGDTLVINPGSVGGINEQRRGQLAIYDSEQDEVELLSL